MYENEDREWPDEVTERLQAYADRVGISLDEALEEFIAYLANDFGIDDWTVEEDDRLLKKKERMLNGSIDSVLRGSGLIGASISTLKNMGIKFAEQRQATGYSKDESAVILELANLSPPLGIKLRKIVNAEKTINYNENEWCANCGRFN